MTCPNTFNVAALAKWMNMDEFSKFLMNIDGVSGGIQVL